MNYFYLGEIVNTHGIKGEVRIISDFKYKNDVFKVGHFLYVGNYKDKMEINSYRIHKNYDMVTFKGINDINDVLKYKGKKVYFIREEYKFEGILDEDIIGLDVYSENTKIGSVISILKSAAHEILEIKLLNGKSAMIPYIDNFVKKIDLANKKVDVELIEGLIDEN